MPYLLTANMPTKVVVVLRALCGGPCSPHRIAWIHQSHDLSCDCWDVVLLLVLLDVCVACSVA